MIKQVSHPVAGADPAGFTLALEVAYELHPAGDAGARGGVRGGGPPRGERRPQPPPQRRTRLNPALNAPAGNHARLKAFTVLSPLPSHRTRGIASHEPRRRRP
ncbi:hypothetical protein M2158_003970 [Streptomyces sp. SAI-144]|nr:hypothetical protein [Streptomyces sp. SAI-144]